MAVALQTAAELTLQENLNEKLITVFRVPGYEANLVRGHEAALRIIDAGSYVCLCCPPALCNNGMRKSGIGFSNVLRHVTTKQHAACVAHWVKAKRMQHLLRRLRLFALSGGRMCPAMARSRRGTPNAPMLRAVAASKKPRQSSRYMRACVCELHL